MRSRKGRGLALLPTANRPAHGLAVLTPARIKMPNTKPSVHVPAVRFGEI